jgi:hypothetical protein
MNQKRPMQFSAAADIKGETTPEMWRTALRSLQKRHPLLNVSIARQADGPVFQYNSDAPIPLRIINTSLRDAWIHEMQRELTDPFDAEAAPLIRATLLTQERDRTGLLLTAHHSVSDGLSATYLITDLLAALSGKALESLPLMPSDDQLISQIAASLPAAESQSHEPLGELGYAADRAQAHIVSHSFDAGFTSALRECARREGASLHAALCASAVLAVKGMQTGATGRVAFPASTRGILNVGENNGCFVTSGRVDLRLSPRTAFWQLAREVMPGIAHVHDPAQVKNDNRALTAAVATLKEGSQASHFASAAFWADVVVTNLGAISRPLSYGKLALASLWGPGLLMGFSHLPALGAVTHRGSLHLLLSGYEPYSEMLSDVEETLRRACVDA